MERISLKVTGESGMGLLSTGEIIAKTLKYLGYYINADREYPSLIKGGYSSFHIDFSPKPIRSLSSEVDILVALDEPGLINYIDTVKKGGIVIHGHERYQLMKDLPKMLKARKLKSYNLPAREIANSFGGTALMTNMVLLGLLWKILGLPAGHLEEEIKDRFKSKPKLLAIDLKCVKEGHKAPGLKRLPKMKVKRVRKIPKKIMINGNTALALGAIQAGVRTYYAYPMSPSSGILTYLAEKANETEMLVKQAEDEITAAQMAIGSMFVGSRSLVATSGGGFDLMAESLSLSGITENPLVIIDVQRPGPGTGLPTWTGQGDLNIAINTGHGEFSRVVVACSDPTSAYEVVQHALNFAEQFQTLVVILSEKVIAETLTLVDHFPHKKIPIKRGLVTNKSELSKLKSSDRYKITKSGLSKRWLPGSSKTFYFANGDEHWEDGTLTEKADEAKEMYSKRMRKMELIEKATPEPKIYGVKDGAHISFVGWGSSKCVMKDIIEAGKKLGIKVNYLHYEFIYPLKQKTVKKFFKDNKKVFLIEGNYKGQLGNLIEGKTGLKFTGRYLKYNGRPFFFDEVIDFVKKNRTKR